MPTPEVMVDTPTPLLLCKNVEVRRGISSVIRCADLEVKEGEIVGIAGVQGNGQTELVESITGLRDFVAGKVSYFEKKMEYITPREIHKLGIRHIPEDRQQRGLVTDFSADENMILGHPK